MCGIFGEHEDDIQSEEPTNRQTHGQTTRRTDTRHDIELYTTDMMFYKHLIVVDKSVALVTDARTEHDCELQVSVTFSK